ncbi:unnamed protein product, partial [Closterium sp. NIES-54]
CHATERPAALPERRPARARSACSCAALPARALCTRTLLPTTPARQHAPLPNALACPAARSASRCGAARWGVSGGGKMRLQQRQRESLPPQQLREWYTSRGGGGGSSGGRSAAVQLGVPGGGLTTLQRRPRETLLPQQLCDLATFTRPPGSSLYTLATKPPKVAASAQVSASGQVSASLAALACPALPSLRVQGRQRAGPHSSSFPPMTAPLKTLHMDVWGPARVSGQDRERYFLLVVDDYTRYTTVFPLRSKGEVPDVLLPWIRAVRLQLREQFRQDLPVLRLHSDRVGDFSSNLLRDICHGEGILQSFMLLDSPQQNGIAERRIGLVMEVARTSMIHAAAPHFLWPFAVRYAAHQLNLWHRISLPETSPTLRWTGKVGDASVLRDVTFDESVPFYRLFPYRSAPLPSLPLFLAPGPPPVDPLPPQGPAPSGVSQVDPPPGAVPGEVAVDSGATRGTASRGAEPGGVVLGGVKTGGAEPGGVETGGAEARGSKTEGVEPGGAVLEGAESGGAEPQGAALSGGSAGASPRLSPQQLREWFVRRAHLRSGATRAGCTGAAGVAAGAGVTGGTSATGPGGARTKGTKAVATGGGGGAGAGDPTESGAAGAGGSGAEGAGARGAEVGGTRAGGARVGGTSAGGAGCGGAGAVDPSGTVRSRPYFVPLLQQVLGVLSSTGLTPPLLYPPPDPLQPASPLPTPPHTEQSSGLTERHEPASRPVLPVRTAHRVPRSRHPPVPNTHAMALRPSSVPLHVPLPAPPESSLPEVPDLESDRTRAASPTVSRLLATALTDPSFESATSSALVAKLLDFSAACRLDYATALVAESTSASPPFVGSECALGTDVLEDRQEEFECLAAAVPRFAAMLLAPEGDPDASDIPTPRSYAEAITGPYSSQWQAAMDAEMASWKSTGTYVDEVPPPGVNIVDGMWIFRVKRPPGSPPAFKARYVARDFSQRQEVDYFQNFSPTPKMTTLEAPRKWHDTLRTTLAALGFAPSTADPSLFIRTNTSLPPFYMLVYVDDLVFATADTEALTLVKSELQKRHKCSDLGPSALWLAVLLSTAQSSVYQPLALSSTFGRVRRAEWSHPELVGCLMYLMTRTRPDLAYPLSLLARYVAPDRHRKVHWDAAKRVLRYLCSTPATTSTATAATAATATATAATAAATTATATTATTTATAATGTAVTAATATATTASPLAPPAAPQAA